MTWQSIEVGVEELMLPSHTESHSQSFYLRKDRISYSSFHWQEFTRKDGVKILRKIPMENISVTVKIDKYGDLNLRLFLTKGSRRRTEDITADPLILAQRLLMDDSSVFHLHLKEFLTQIQILVEKLGFKWRKPGSRMMRPMTEFAGTFIMNAYPTLFEGKDESYNEEIFLERLDEIKLLRMFASSSLLRGEEKRVKTALSWPLDKPLLNMGTRQSWQIVLLVLFRGLVPGEALEKEFKKAPPAPKEAPMSLSSSTWLTDPGLKRWLDEPATLLLRRMLKAQKPEHRFTIFSQKLLEVSQIISKGKNDPITGLLAGFMPKIKAEELAVMDPSLLVTAEATNLSEFSDNIREQDEFIHQDTLTREQSHIIQVRELLENHLGLSNIGTVVLQDACLEPMTRPSRAGIIPLHHLNYSTKSQTNVMVANYLSPLFPSPVRGDTRRLAKAVNVFCFGWKWKRLKKGTMAAGRIAPFLPQELKAAWEEIILASESAMRNHGIVVSPENTKRVISFWLSYYLTFGLFPQADCWDLLHEKEIPLRIAIPAHYLDLGLTLAKTYASAPTELLYGLIQDHKNLFSR